MNWNRILAYAQYIVLDPSLIKLAQGDGSLVVNFEGGRFVFSATENATPRKRSGRSRTQGKGTPRLHRKKSK